MNKLTKMKIGWKYRRQIWKYRGLIRHRGEIAAGAITSAALVTAFVRHGAHR